MCYVAFVWAKAWKLTGGGDDRYRPRHRVGPRIGSRLHIVLYVLSGEEFRMVLSRAQPKLSLVLCACPVLEKSAMFLMLMTKTEQ